MKESPVERLRIIAEHENRNSPQELLENYTEDIGECPSCGARLYHRVEIRVTTISTKYHFATGSPYCDKDSNPNI